MPKRTVQEQRTHDVLVKVLPLVSSMSLTEGSWEKGAESLVKALKVYDLTIVTVDEALSKKAPRGRHPHGVPLQWDADGKCSATKSCNEYKDEASRRAALAKAQPAVVAPPEGEPVPRPKPGPPPVVVEPVVSKLRVIPEGHRPAKVETSPRMPGVYVLPDGRVLEPAAEDYHVRRQSLDAFTELGLGQEFWDMEPSADEVVGALNHVLGIVG